MIFVLTFHSENDKNKFIALFKEYHKLLYYFAIDILHNHADAEDAVQITYLKVFKNLDKVDKINERKTVNYLVTILKNTAFHIYNKNKGSSKHIEEDADEIFEQRNRSITFHSLHFGNLKLIIESLDNKYRFPLLLMYVYGFSIAEIAEIMELSESNVGTRIYRAKIKIKDALYEMGEGYEI